MSGTKTTYNPAPLYVAGALDVARELRIQLEQYFAKVFSESDVYPEVKWLCEPEEIDKIIQAWADRWIARSAAR